MVVRLLFRDEARFCLGMPDGRPRVRRRCGETSVPQTDLERPIVLLVYWLSFCIWLFIENYFNIVLHRYKFFPWFIIVRFYMFYFTYISLKIFKLLFFFYLCLRIALLIFNLHQCIVCIWSIFPDIAKIRVQRIFIWKKNIICSLILLLPNSFVIHVPFSVLSKNEGTHHTLTSIMFCQFSSQKHIFYLHVFKYNLFDISFMVTI